MSQRRPEPKATYERKISAEEESEQYLFVLKNKLGFFPPAPEPFQLRVGASKKDAKVESYACTCRGPELPHEHYFIRCGGLKKGATAIVSRDAEGQYSLTVGK